MNTFSFFFIGLVTSLVFTSDGFTQSLDVPVSGAQPKSFSTSGDNLGFLQNSVNLFSGQVQFSLPIASIAGRSGVSYTLAFSYSSKVKSQAETWNREAPTGVLGLGWVFSTPKIVVDHKGTGTREDDTFYLVEGGSTSQLFYDGLDGSDWKFYPKAYQFWQIKYNPAAEIWTIIKEDGTKYIYGDQSSSRKTVQYVVKWGNWIGNSGNYNGQQQQASAWNLSEISDLWNDKLTFEYIEDYDFIGGVQSQTVASYLKEVKNALGEKITLTYQVKLNNELIPGSSNYGTEYIDPHGVYSRGHQDNFESRYIEMVTQYDAANQKIEEVKMSYDFLGTGEMVKRLLNSITSYNSLGEASQPYIFSYEKNFDDQSNTYNTGALREVTAPTKGSVNFTYQMKSLENTSRDYFVDKVDNSSGIYTEPQFWFGDDFVVMSRRLKPGPNADWPSTPHSAAQQPVILDVFTWDGGKWIRKSLGSLQNVTLSGSPIKKQDFQVVVGRDFIATLNRWGTTNRYDLSLFKKNDDLPGEWYSETIVCSRVNDPGTAPYINLGDDPKLLAGDSFVLVGAKTSKFFVFEWRGARWGSWNANISSEPHYYSAASNYFVMHDRNGRFGVDIIEFRVKNKGGQWQTFTVPAGTSFNSTSSDSYWYASNSFAVVMAANNNEFIYTWDENFSNFKRFDTGIGIDDTSPVIIRGPLVLMTAPGNVSDKGYAFRYDGQVWKPSGTLNYFGQAVGLRNLFSVGEDFIYRPYASFPSSGTIYYSYVREFDVSLRQWKTDANVGPRNSNNYASIAGNNFLMCDGRVYFRNTSGTFGSATDTELASFLTNAKYASRPVSAGYDFIAYSFPPNDSGQPYDGGTKLVMLKNGQIQSQITRSATDSGLDPNTFSETIFDAIHSVSGFVMVPSPQVSGNTIVTFFASTNEIYQQNSRRFKLYRKVGNNIAGSLTDFVAVKVTTNDGQTSNFTTYDYITGTATTDASGTNFQFNEVRAIPGSTNPIPSSPNDYVSASVPFGYTKSFFMNGKASSELGSAATYPVVVGMQDYFKKLTGAAYKSLIYNSSNALVASTATDYGHSYWNQYSESASFYVRPSFTVTEKDGIKDQTQMIYNSKGQIDWEITARLSSSGSIIEQLKNEYAYYWQFYDANLTNLLSPLVYKRYLVDNNYVDVAGTRWKNWGASNTPAPYDNYRWVGPSLAGWTSDPNQTPSSEWQFLSKVNTRDPVSGAVIEEQKKGGLVESILLDEFKRFPVAVVSNASLNELGYCGFEDTATGNFTWSDGTITSGDSKTGNRFFKLGPAGITKSGLNSSVKYTLSFWAKSSGGSVIIDGVGTVNLGTLSQWTLFEFNVTGLASCNVRRSGAIEVQVDDVRFLPSNARMSTSTYHPVFGKTSDTDANHNTVFYEFDSFGKPKFVRDQDKNIVRHVFSNIRY
jgi:hypothetical protein